MIKYTSLLAAVHFAFLAFAAPLSPTAAQSPYHKTILVEIDGSGFSTPIVDANIGDKVVFFNRGSTQHLVAQSSRETHLVGLGSATSGPLAPDNGWAITIETPGLLQFRSLLRPDFIVQILAR